MSSPSHPTAPPPRPLPTAPARSSPAIGRVAIIGAGVTGLTCASALRDHGVDVVVFDKGRAPGGRLTTRRARDLEVDLGAPYFTVRDPAFERFVRTCIDEGIVAPFGARFGAVAAAGGSMEETPPMVRYVGVPGMSQVARRLARDLDVRTSHRVDTLARRAGRIELSGLAGEPGTTLAPSRGDDEAARRELGTYDVVVVCVPSDQAHPLVRPVSPTLADAVATTTCEPCLALGFVSRAAALRELPFDALFIGRDGDPGRVLAWLGRESSKPARTTRDAWMLHAAPGWSRAHLRDPEPTIAATMLDALARVVGVSAPIEIGPSTLRRWAHARAPASPAPGARFDVDRRIGVGGDWSTGGRVEGAYLTGLALAQGVLDLPDLPDLPASAGA